MKISVILSLLLTVSLQARIWEVHEAKDKMDWENGMRYCFNLQARLPRIEELETAYTKQLTATDGRNFSKDYYWSRTSEGIEGAYSFNFAMGLSYSDYKSNKYRILCIR